jgi:hypothetical protein
VRRTATTSAAGAAGAGAAEAGAEDSAAGVAGRVGASQTRASLRGRRSGGNGQRPSRTWARYSSRNMRIPAATEGGIDGPSTQMVVWAGGQATPGEMLSHTSMRRSRSDSRPWPSLDALQDLLQPAAALAARRALTARLPVEEAHDAPCGAHHTGGVVHRDDRARTGHGAPAAAMARWPGDVELLGPQPWRGYATGDEHFELVAVADSAAEARVEDQVPEGGLGPLQLVVARPFHVPGQGQELRTRGPSFAQCGEVRRRR